MGVAATPKMFLPQALEPQVRTAIAHRRPLNYTCTCGLRELVGPPCGTGTIRWKCECGQEWLLRFQGHGSGVKDELFKRGQQ